MKTTWLRVLGLGFAVIALSAGFASAQQVDPQCFNQCIGDYEQDLQACESQLQQCLTGVSEAFNECIQGAAGDPFKEFQCFQKSNVQTEACEREAKQCQARANTDGYDCYRRCLASPDAP